MAVKTTQEIESYITPLFKLLKLNPKEPKWIGLRFMINISLSIKHKKFQIELNSDFNGSEYQLKQLTGEHKENENFTNYYHKMIESYDEMELKTVREFEKRLEYHIQRGYEILNKSQTKKFNIYEFMLQEF